MTKAHEVPTACSGVITAAAVYGVEDVPLDDPAEHFHEASKLYPSTTRRTMHGIQRFENRVELKEASRRAGKRHPHRPRVPLPEPALPPTSFGQVLYARRSVRSFGESELTARDLSTLLFAAYGPTGELGDGHVVRTVPSGGALYPLEVYVVPTRAGGIPGGLYHYEPVERVLEHIGGTDRSAELLAASLYPEVSEAAAALVLITAMFWRTRCKYGLRGYRYALIEAGHLAQNLLLAAAALGLVAVPIAGFFDGRVDAALSLDGVNESVLYWLCVGTGPEAEPGP